MKVLHVLGELNHSGAERMLACSAEQWRAAGVEATIAGMANGSHRFSEHLRGAGYEVLILPDARSVRGLRELARAIRVQRPQIVHVHAERCFDSVSLVAKLAPSVDVVVRTVHNHFAYKGLLRLRRHIRFRLAALLGVSWVACSPEVAKTERSYLSRRSVSIVENWIDVDSIRIGATAQAGIHIRRELGIASAAPVLVLIGNCGPAKNHEFVPDLVNGLQKPVHLLHVGKRRDQSQAETRAWRTVVRRHTVHHLGERDDVPALLAASDLMLMPSLYEGRPLVTMEALCAGVPILASDVPGLRWLDEFASTRLLPLAAPEWSQAVARALTSDASKHAAPTAAATARAKFGPERGVAEYLDLYRSARRARRREPLLQEAEVP